MDLNVLEGSERTEEEKPELCVSLVYCVCSGRSVRQCDERRCQKINIYEYN